MINTLLLSNPRIRIGLFFVIWVLLWLPLAIPIAKWVQWRPQEPVTVSQKLALMTPLYLLVPVLMWGMTRLTGVDLATYGLSWDVKMVLSLLWGIGLALAGLGLVFTLEGIGKGLEWRWENLNRLLPLILPLLGLGLWVGGTEELVFRGFLQTELGEIFPEWLAAVAGSTMFAVLHLLWEREKTLPQLPGLGLMGIILVLGRWVDGGSLGLAWGLHAGWICGLSCLTGAELIRYTGHLSPWITGFKEEPLAGIAGISCLLGTGAVLWMFLP